MSTPPNEKTGISYAQATAAPRSAPPPIAHRRSATPESPDEHSSQTSRSPSSVSSPHPAGTATPPPSETASISYAQVAAADNPPPVVHSEQQQQHKADRRRRRRDREEQERHEEWGQHEQEKFGRRRERRGAGSGGASAPESAGSPRPEKVRQGDDESRVPLVTAVKKVPWAPLAIPLPRRLQTAAVLLHTLSMSLCFSLFWFVVAIPLSWPLLLPYLVYVFFLATAHADGSAPYRRSERLRSLPLWRLYADYFPMRLHRTVPLDPARNYVFAYHPHGIISHGAFGNFVTEATGFKQLFPGIRNTLLTIDSNFCIPFNREYLLALGLASVSRRSCEAILRGDGVPPPPRPAARRSLWRPSTWLARSGPPPPPPDARGGGRAITIVVGGARESLEALPGRMKLVCKKRRGFLKLAMREGAGVVPVLSFGENDLYQQLVPGEESWIRKLQLAAKKTLGFTIPLVHARGIFNYDVGILPYRHPINTVVGKPIFPHRNPDPSDDDVAQLAQRYMAELQRMWDEYKDVFAQDRLPGDEGEMAIIE